MQKSDNFWKILGKYLNLVVHIGLTMACCTGISTAIGIYIKNHYINNNIVIIIAIIIGILSGFLNIYKMIMLMENSVINKNE